MSDSDVREVETGHMLSSREIVERLNAQDALLLKRAQEIAELQEREALKLVACEVAALSNTPASYEATNIEAQHPAWSLAWSSVRSAIAREMGLREQLESRAQEIAALKQTIDRLKSERDGWHQRFLGMSEEMLTVQAELDTETEELAAAGKPHDYDEARRYLTALLARVAPQCEPLSTLTGLATQIDNYIAGALVHGNASRPPR